MARDLCFGEDREDRVLSVLSILSILLSALLVSASRLCLFSTRKHKPRVMSLSTFFSGYIAAIS